MNIHIDSKHLHYLVEQSIFHCSIGSQLYGTANEQSDTDLLYIYPESINEVNNPFFNHHQFQIKQDGIDYIFSSIRQFVRNLIQGDSSINIDVLMLTDICSVIPAFQTLKYEISICYPVLKCLLGMAKRDLKSASSTKKLGHVARGLASYEWLREKKYYNKEDIQELHQQTHLLENLQGKEKVLRKELNTDYDANILKKHLSVTCQQEIVTYLSSLERPPHNDLLNYQLEANNNKAFYY